MVFTIFTIIYAAFWVGIGELVRRYPETISGFSTMSKERRAKYDMPKIGLFIAKWMRGSAAAVLLSLALPEPLKMQVLVFVPIILIGICYAYLLKYRDVRFLKGE